MCTAGRFLEPRKDTGLVGEVADGGGEDMLVLGLLYVKIQIVDCSH